VVDQQGFQRLAEVLDQVKPVHHLRGLGRPPANTVGVELAPVATDDGDRRMLGQPDGDGGSRAVRQEIDDPMGCQINEDGTIPMASPPRPLVHSDELQGQGRGDHGCAHES
jgi:hypothetical protein